MEKTPTKAGVDTADYLLTEESLIDYMKLFKFRTDTDYIPLLISAGFDSVVNSPTATPSAAVGDDLSVRVKTLIAALPYKEEDVELGDALLPTLPDHILTFINGESSGLRIVRDISKPVVKTTSKHVLDLRERFNYAKPFSSGDSILFELNEWEALRDERPRKHESGTKHMKCQTPKSLIR